MLHHQRHHPRLKAINDEFSLAHGNIETAHSFTNYQNVTDSYHKGHRRGRSASLTILIAETDAAKAVAKALLELAGKLTGRSCCAPTRRSTPRDTIGTAIRAGAQVSVTVKQDVRVKAAIKTVPDQAWTPIACRKAV